MGSRKYLIIFQAVSSGLNGPLLGTDEQEIVLLVYLVLDIVNNKVIGQKPYTLSTPLKRKLSVAGIPRYYTK